HWQIMPTSNLVVIGVMRRRYLYGSCTKFSIHKLVSQNWNLAICQGQADGFTNVLSKSLIIRMHRDSGVAKHRLWSCCRNDHFPTTICEWVADVPHMPF